MRHASLLLAATLAACAGPAPRYSDQVIDRVLATAPYEAQPSKVVAAEIAFARMAREEGQWTAFHEFAADQAIIHGRSGPIEAKPWLAEQEDPPAAVQWGPRAVWMSCDGTLAVSRGRFIDPDGTVGTFVTVWQRQTDESYRWIYDGGVPDDPQPAPADKPSADEIVVTGMDLIRGHVAECPERGASPPPPPAFTVPGDYRSGGGFSRDRTLYWHWQHSPEGKRDIAAYYVVDGDWTKAFEQSLDPAG